MTNRPPQAKQKRRGALPSVVAWETPAQGSFGLDRSSARLSRLNLEYPVIHGNSTIVTQLTQACPLFSGVDNGPGLRWAVSPLQDRAATDAASMRHAKLAFAFAADTSLSLTPRRRRQRLRPWSVVCSLRTSNGHSREPWRAEGWLRGCLEIMIMHGCVRCGHQLLQA